MKLMLSQPCARIFHLLFVHESTELSWLNVCKTDSSCVAGVTAVLWPCSTHSLLLQLEAKPEHFLYKKGSCLFLPLFLTRTHATIEAFVYHTLEIYSDGGWDLPPVTLLGTLLLFLCRALKTRTHVIPNPLWWQSLTIGWTSLTAKWEMFFSPPFWSPPPGITPWVTSGPQMDEYCRYPHQLAYPNDNFHA